MVVAAAVTLLAGRSVHAQGAAGPDTVALRGLQPLQPLSREAAADAALTHGARAALARADSLVAGATLLSARAYANPTANLTYTRDTPHYHGILSFPFDYPWVRSVRVRSAEAGLRSASYRYAFERAAVRFETDTMYTRALAAADRSRLSRRNALDADSLRQLAVVRRDAGDASDMDVELATVNAQQQANAATADSLAAIGAVLDLQSVVGLPSDRTAVVLTDSLTLPAPADALAPDSGPAEAAAAPGSGSVRHPARSMRAPASGSPSPAVTSAVTSAATPAGPVAAPGVAPAGPPASTTIPLQVAAAQAALEAEQSSLALAHRSVLGQPALQAGVEGGDPTQPFPLPTFGLSIPFPLFNHNGGEVALAVASRDRALAELEVTRRASAAQVAQAVREQTAALTRARRDRTVLDLATHVVARSLTAFAEGASALPAVLEAQRSARDALAQYVDDVAAANNATAAVRLFTLTVPPSSR